MIDTTSKNLLIPVELVTLEKPEGSTSFIYEYGCFIE